MAQAKIGDVVKVHYTGKLKDGTVFDTSVEREPLKFELGKGDVIPGFEKAVVDMKPGDSKTVEIESEKAYGPYREEMVAVVEKSKLPKDLSPKVGQQLQVRHDDGKTIVVTVKEITDSNIKVDANHPLAGKDLIFEIKLVEIV